MILTPYGNNSHHGATTTGKLKLLVRQIMRPEKHTPY